MTDTRTNQQTLIVKGDKGLRGQIDITGPMVDEQDEVLIQFDNGETVSIPFHMLTLTDDGSYYLPLSAEQLQMAQAEAGPITITIPVIEERANVFRRKVERARVRIEKKVHEREETIQDTGYEEEVQIERIPKNELLDQPLSVRHEGDTMVIPVMEEILVVEKRLVLKEEVRVTRRKQAAREPKRVRLRREEVIVERTPIEDPESQST